MRRLYLLIALELICIFPLYAQKERTVKGEYIYYPSETESLDVAKRTALYRAQMQILADTYGTILNMTSTTVVQNVAEQSDIKMYTLGESSVKGEWLETIGDPKYTTDITPNGMISIKVEVTGKVRELKQVQAIFDAKILRNGVEDKFEDTYFNTGDDMYLSFSAPVDGFLTVYLFDGGKDVYCLLPYQNTRDGIVRTEAGKRHVFFSSAYPYGVELNSEVDEYTLTCSGNIELNRVYIIWSTRTFIKANDHKSDELLPRHLDYSSFQKWLSTLRTTNSDIAVKTFDIEIRNNN